jgi:hypothetical protein
MNQPTQLQKSCSVAYCWLSCSQQVSNFKFGEADEDSAVKTAKKIPTKKFTDLAGNIFKGDDEAPGTAEKHHLSTAKLKEMTGSDIFADGEAPSRDYLGGIRKPPGGESSIALV